MPEPPNSLNQVLPTKKLFSKSLLYFPINVVQEHVRHTRSLPVPRQDRRRENRTHPTWRFGEVPSRRVDHYQIPLRLVHLVGKILERQTTPRVAT